MRDFILCSYKKYYNSNDFIELLIGLSAMTVKPKFIKEWNVLNTFAFNFKCLPIKHLFTVLI